MQSEDIKAEKKRRILSVVCPKCESPRRVMCTKPGGGPSNKHPHRERIKLSGVGSESFDFRSGDFVTVFNGPRTGHTGKIVKLRKDEELVAGYERGHHILTVVPKHFLHKNGR